MNAKLFGTDGLRGQVNIYPMVPEVAMRLGLAAGTYFRNGSKKHRAVIGKDTRLSGYVFEFALASGLCASGMDVFLVGPMPTPAISFLTRSMRADIGVVISASHNPFMDNGIKFFDKEGFKLPDEAEEAITAMVLNEDHRWKYPAPEDVGRAYKVDDAEGRYNVFVKNTIPGDLTLDGLKVVVDCANGAAYKVAPLILEELGAQVIRMGNKPDGLNINRQCGSLYPDMVAACVREEGAHLGIALDGDADRLIVVDENGRILDGDQIMAMVAQDMMDRGQLPGNKLVATVMSNMALEVFMKERGGTLVRTPVGDRHVVEAMKREGAVFGGEQSGHLIFLNHTTTGDGTLAALQLLRIMQEQQRPLSELAHLIEPFPQVLLNVHVERKIPFAQCPGLLEAVAAAEAKLGDKGRVLLRYSGTEAVARVMVEGEHRDLVEELAQYLAQAVVAHLK
ncbi:phosphoglucosamine mutase [Megalodesulfovibrio gigas]|uniref:Phosphoglucosamine mutase n=1 Tax=Megalodesulfovibrio gigas (strain ATCC 19364 / DSM 1382 / NCIMB 9332 / VKM B-1759) TaxID=1121448 RepID=T2G8K6_MEGG1|nr:phosphoglucosamine mutase [Megalodesulfovibrio gigas]AGW12227.1 putative phosphoglucosamine mutase [Megalodesulfovibrio gigas DSM 1382 = ATCC 19364]